MAKRKVDINVATEDELVSSLGIEKSMAQAIVDHRKQHGLFKSTRDLALIAGIGQEILSFSWTQYCFVTLEDDNGAADKRNASLSLLSSQRSRDWDSKWTSRRDMSIWRNRKKELSVTNDGQTHEISDILHPVATCSHVDQQTSDTPGCSGQSSSSLTTFNTSTTISDSSDKKVIAEKEVIGCSSSNSPKAIKTVSSHQICESNSTNNDADVCTVMESTYRSESDGAVVIFGEVVQFHKRTEGDTGTSDVKAPTFCDNTDDMRSLESDHEGPAEDEDLEENNLCSSPKEVNISEKMPLGGGDSRLCNGSESSTECECQDDVQSGNANCSTACHEKVVLMKRKPDLDGREPQIGKKPCLTGTSDSGVVDVSSDRHKGILEKVPSTATASSLKKRIPTKDNPPPELAKWLETFQTWGNAERLMAIDQLIDLCEPTQVRHMMSVIEPQFQRDFISLLPKELALYVLSFLEPKDLLRAAQTCRYWRILAEDNLLWREKCREAGIDEVRDIGSKRRLKVGPVPSPWKAAYMRQHNIEMNWRYRPIRPPKVLKGHDDHVITCLQFSGTRIVSGSDDNTLKVWSATTGKCLKTLVGHTGGVWSSQMAGNIIVSGSTDRTLKVWNADTGHCIHTLYGHTSTVRCMHLHGNTVVSGSRDATLRVWDIGTGQCLHVLVGHVAAVRCVQYDGRLVVSGAYDYVVKVWNPEREECIHTLQGHTNRVYSLQFDGIHVVSGSLDTSIRVWDVETGACKHTLIGHQSLTSGMELKNNILVSGNADSTVKVWDIATGQCLQTLSGTHKHNSAVTCLQFNSKFVITSSDDGTVKLWDLKTGEFIRNLVALESGGSGGVVWRIRASPTKLVCAVGSRNGTEETKLLVLDFDVEVK